MIFEARFLRARLIPDLKTFTLLVAALVCSVRVLLKAVDGFRVRVSKPGEQLVREYRLLTQ